MSFRLILAVAVLALASCGHSEDDWQAQLSKYDALSKQHSATQTELDAARARVQQLQQELKDLGLKIQDFDQMRAALNDYRKRAETLERIKARFEALRNKLQKLTELGLKVEIRRNRMVISLPGDVLFASGRDQLRDEGKDVLRQVADVIRNDQQLVKRHYQVAGHTDNKPLTTTKAMFKDNWGLSLMRAREVLVYLTSKADDKGGGGALDPNRWSASGYGDTDPVSQNDSEDGRQKNRRVELILMPDVEEMLDLKSFI
ncbi:MAG: OmpA family protein [Polyangiaceae bacterium]|jgi:chemotaxis protein MotB|nr:OmpA family protein [Polyangiaceae bacterium]